MQRIFPFLFALCASALVATSAVAAPVIVAGVEYPEALVVAGSPVVLNGAGVRYKTVFKVYTAALYVSSRARTTQEVQAKPGAKRLSITMLRSIDSVALGRMFTRGIEDNLNRASFSKLIPGILRMSEIFSSHKALEAGDTFTIDWVPGTGTVLAVKGVKQGDPFTEDAFFDALMAIWLGDRPADFQLKDALLGKS